MDPLRALTAVTGFFTRREALGAGYRDRDLTRMVRQKVVVRFRRGFYAFTDEWGALDEVARHRVRSRAVLRSLGDDVALSHVSGVVHHGIDVWGVPLDKVHVTRLDGAPGRIEGDVVHHAGDALGDDVQRVAGAPVLRAERCALEAASRANNEVALCLLDAGLRRGAFDEEQLGLCHQRLQVWPYMRHLQVVVRMASGKSGSIGESRGRWHLRIVGVPAPELQFDVYDEDGTLIGTCDWGWPDLGVLGEFDGRVKYGRLLEPDQEPGDVVFAEKRREDLLREATGFRMFRLIWSDYERPSLLRRRLKHYFPIAG